MLITYQALMTCPERSLLKKDQSVVRSLMELRQRVLRLVQSGLKARELLLVMIHQRTGHT